MHRFALAGDPVEHSLSPVMHRAAFAATGLDGSYHLAPCDAAGFAALVEALGPGGYTGLNVTMPHKGLAYQLCDTLTGEAEAASSVNAMRRTDSSVEGHSSDVVAFRQIFEELGSGAEILVLGSGGSARAAIAAAGDQIPIRVRARNQEAVAELQARYGATPLTDRGPVVGAVVVNATPIGMNGEELDPETVSAAAALIDLPYASGLTPAVALARSLGTPVYDGYDFLARQAAVSFTWWTGVPIDVSTMARAARNT